MRNTVTRSFSTNVCKAIIYKEGKLSDTEITIPTGFNATESAEKYIRKNVTLDGKLVTVESVVTVSELYGMDESDFISKATLIDERSKDTRDCVTKTVKGNVGTLVYMTKNRKIHEMPVMIRSGEKLSKVAKEKAPQDCIGITIENIHDSVALYAMSISDFIKYARPMVDHQHYKL